MVNIIVVFPKLEDAKNIRNLLARNGYSVIGVCCTGAQVCFPLLHARIASCPSLSIHICRYAIYQRSALGGSNTRDAIIVFCNPSLRGDTIATIGIIPYMQMIGTKSSNRERRSVIRMSCSLLIIALRGYTAYIHPPQLGL